MRIKPFIIIGATLAGHLTALAETEFTDSIGLSEVVVTGSRNVTDIRHLPQTVTVVDHLKLTENQRTNVLPTLMEQVPGLMVTSRGMMGYGVSTGGSGGMMLRGISWYQSAVLWSGARLTVGFDYQNIYGHAYYTDRQNGNVLETPNKQSGEERNHELAGYVDLRQDLFTWLTAEAGVRYDHHTITGGEWIPQAGIVVRPLRSGELKLMASKGFRNPTMREMYLYPPSNTDLKPERMWSYELSWKHRIASGRLQYGINLFCIDADNIIQTVNRQNVNTGELNNKGIEFELQYRINSHWTLNTNHSWLDMRQPVLSAPKYKSHAGVTMSYGRWRANVGLTEVCGLYTAIGDNEHTEAFTLLNATVSYALCHHVTLWLKGDNLLAQRYEYIAGMPMPKATFMAGLNLEF